MVQPRMAGADIRPVIQLQFLDYLIREVSEQLQPVVGYLKPLSPK
jgi:hypothetical protein